MTLTPPLRTIFLLALVSALACGRAPDSTGDGGKTDGDVSSDAGVDAGSDACSTATYMQAALSRVSAQCECWSQQVPDYDYQACYEEGGGMAVTDPAYVPCAERVIDSRPEWQAAAGCAAPIFCEQAACFARTGCAESCRLEAERALGQRCPAGTGDEITRFEAAITPACGEPPP